MYSPIHTVFRRYRFDAFEVDTRAGILRQNGAAVPLQDIPFRFLAALLEHPGEPRSREELRAEVWPAGVNLDFEGALRTAAHKVRQALGDSSQLPRYIETLPGRGFRFVGEVTVEPVEPEPAPATVGIGPPAMVGRRLPVWTTTALLAGLGAVLLLNGRPWAGRGAEHLPAPAPCVVALPTKVLGAQDSAFLTDAVPDTLSTLLGKEGGLDTKLPPTSTQIEKIHGDVAKIAGAYGADYLILTTVTAERDHLLLNVKLAEAATQKVRWASQYEATRDNFNGLLRDAAQAIAAVMKPGTADPRAFGSGVELALREGRHFQRQFESSRNSHDLDLALAAFRKAQSLDSQNTLLASEIATLLETRRALGPEGKAGTSASPENSQVDLALQEAAFFLRRYGAVGQPELHAKARAALDRAYAMDPKSGKVAAQIAWLWNAKWGRDGDPKAMAESGVWARRAIELDPRHGPAWTALAGSVEVKSLADFDQVFGWVVKAIRLTPRDAGVNSTLGGIAPGPLFMVACGLRSLELDPLGDLDAGMVASGLVWLGRPAEALAALDRGLALAPDATFLLNAKALALARLGRVQEAEAVLERSQPKETNPDSFTLDYWNEVRVAVLAAKGSTPAARAAGVDLTAHHLRPSTPPFDLLNGVQTTVPDLLRLGLREEALRLLDHSARGAIGPGQEWLDGAPELRPLRGEPRFQRARETARKVTVVMVKHLQEAKAAGELPPYLEKPLAELKALLKPHTA